MTTEETKKKSSLFFDSYGNPRSGMIISAVIIAIICIGIFFGIVSEFYQIVPPPHVGLVIKGGELQEQVLDNGFYPKTPFWTDIIPRIWLINSDGCRVAAPTFATTTPAA